jgi:hypothetical protein
MYEQLLPLFDTGEHDWHELGAPELPSSGVDPYNRLVLFRAKHDHVVVRRNDDLVRVPCMRENFGVIGTAGRCPVTLMANVARSDA